MALVGDVYIQGLVQTGPPPGSQLEAELITHWYFPRSIAEMKTIASGPQNEHRAAFLLGQESDGDGLLQGIYTYVPQSHLDVSLGDDASYVVVNDGRSAWKKRT